MDPTERTQSQDQSDREDRSFDVQIPSWADVDRELSRRPGVARFHEEPHAMPNTRFPPVRQEGEPAAPLHGRPNKEMPPVFGTAQPLHGASGILRRFAARSPDHLARYWLMKMFADRVELWSHRVRKGVGLTVPVMLAGWAGRRIWRATG